MTERRLFEILIPIKSNDGIAFTSEYNRVYRDTLLSYTGGMSDLISILGHWYDPETKLIQTEEMIPIRLWCFPETMADIAKYTKVYFDQKEVMYYELSDKVYMV